MAMNNLRQRHKRNLFQPSQQKMGDIWCENKELALDLLKEFSQLEPTETALKKGLPDLYYCVECVLEFHKLKEHHLSDQQSNENVLRIEPGRIYDHLSCA